MQAPLYAKVSGYVTKLNVDIGDSVRAGQVLAELSVPELEEQLHQKEALAGGGRRLRIASAWCRLPKRQSCGRRRRSSWPRPA